MASKDFQDLDVLRDPDGVVALITHRTRDGRVELSFSIGKEFDRDGKVERTVFLKPQHLPALARLVEALPAHLELLEDRLRAARRSNKGG